MSRTITTRESPAAQGQGSGLGRAAACRPRRQRGRAEADSRLRTGRDLGSWPNCQHRQLCGGRYSKLQKTMVCALCGLCSLSRRGTAGSCSCVCGSPCRATSRVPGRVNMLRLLHKNELRSRHGDRNTLTHIATPNPHECTTTRILTLPVTWPGARQARRPWAPRSSCGGRCVCFPHNPPAPRRHRTTLR